MLWQGENCPVTAHFGHHVERWKALVYLFPIPSNSPSLPSFGESAAQQRLHPQVAPLYPEGAGPPPALQLSPANREVCASF